MEIINTEGEVFNMFNSVSGHAQEFGHAGAHEVAEEGFVGTLLHHLGKTAEILIFLIGAMTIVEIVDLHRGFDVLKGWVNTRSKKAATVDHGRALAFILSAIIDNLTATIVLVTLLRKLVPERERTHLVRCPHRDRRQRRRGLVAHR